MFCLFTILAFYKLIVFLKNPTRKNALLYGIFAALMLYGHFFAFFALAAQALIIFFFFLISEKEKRKPFFINALLAGIIAVILFLPTLQLLIEAAKIKKSWIKPPSTYPFTNIFIEFFGYSEFLLTLITFVSAFYFIRLSREEKQPVQYRAVIDNRIVFSAVILLPWLIIVMMIPLLKSHLSVPILVSRYLINLLPAFILLIAIGTNEINNTVIKGGFILLFFVFSLANIGLVRKYYTMESKTQYRELSHYIAEKNKTHEPVVSFWGKQFSYFLNRDKPSYPIVDTPLEAYVRILIQDTSKIKSFWYADAHQRPYKPSDTVKLFMGQNFVVEDSVEYFDAWARHYVKKSR